MLKNLLSKYGNFKKIYLHIVATLGFLFGEKLAFIFVALAFFFPKMLPGCQNSPKT
jgi:hypothetical protein